MHALKYIAYDNVKGELIKHRFFPLLVLDSSGIFGFAYDTRFTILPYVGRNDRKGKEIYAGMILCQPLLNEFDSYIPGGIVEVFYCPDDMGWEARDPSGRRPEHWAFNPEAEIIAVNYKEYQTLYPNGFASNMANKKIA